MGIQDFISDINTRLKDMRAKDIKNLVLQQGKLIEGDKEFILKEPEVNDLNLQKIIHDPYVELRPIGESNKSGEMYYDLKANGSMVRIKLVCHLIENEENK